jgi:hypothetical protein
MDIKKALGDLKIDLTSIQDENLRAIIIVLLNAVEQLSNENEVLRQKNQELSDENNRLKGEQGKPKIRPQTKEKDPADTQNIDPDKDTSNHSSEKEREGTEDKKPKTPKPKVTDIKIDRLERIEIDLSTLPPDVIFKGYEPIVVQEIKIVTDNVKFERAVFYSPSTGKTYLAPLPMGYKGTFGPMIKSVVLDLYQDGGVTQPALKRFFETHGIYISSGTISTIITDVIEPFHQEKTDIVDAGLDSTDFHHLDDTASRVNGKNHHAHILCNPFFTAYFTLPSRDRLAAIEVLSNGNLQFIFNEDTFKLMAELGLPEKRLLQFKALNLQPTLMTREAMDAVIRQIFPDAHRHKANQKTIRDAAAIIAYQQYYAKTSVLMTDGALQFQRITEHQALCWVHEGRHYKKLKPVFAIHREALEAYRKEFWQYYRALLAYKKSPNKLKTQELSEAFDVLFSKKTGYKDLDDRIASTLANKTKLLLVLKLPHLPLHNNPAEGGARTQARKRDVSLQTKNAKGTKAKDTLMTIIETAKKLGVNTFKYIYDRISGKYAMTSLADLIRQHSSIPAAG